MLKALTLACTSATLVGASHLRAVHVPQVGPSADTAVVSNLDSATATAATLAATGSNGAHLMARLDGVKARNVQARMRLEQSCSDFETVSKEKQKDAVNLLDEKKAAWASPGGGAWPEIEAAHENAMAEVRDETANLVTAQRRAKEAAEREESIALAEKREASARLDELRLAQAAAKATAASGTAAANKAFHLAESQAQEAEARINARAEKETARILKEAEGRFLSQNELCAKNYESHMKELDGEIAMAQNIKGPLDALINRCQGTLAEPGEWEEGHSFLQVSSRLLSATVSHPAQLEGCADAHKEYNRAQSLLEMESLRYAPAPKEMQKQRQGGLQTQEGVVSDDQTKKSVHEVLAKRYDDWISNMQTAKESADAVKTDCHKEAAKFMESRQMATSKFKAREAMTSLAEKQKSIELAGKIRDDALSLLRKAEEDARAPIARAESQAMSASLKYSEKAGTSESEKEALEHLKKSRQDHAERVEATQKLLRAEAIRRKKNDFLITHGERIAVLETALKEKRMECKFRHQELDAEIKAVQQIREKLHAMLLVVPLSSATGPGGAMTDATGTASPTGGFQMGKAEVNAGIVAGAVAEATGTAGYTGATGAAAASEAALMAGADISVARVAGPTGYSGAAKAPGAAAAAESKGDIVEQEIVEELLSACEPVCPESCVFPMSITDESCGECMKCHGVFVAAGGKGTWSVRDDCKEACKDGQTKTDACARCVGFEKSVTKPCKDDDRITFNRDGKTGPAPGSRGALPGSCEKVRIKSVPARAEFCAESAGKHCPKTCGECEW